MVPLLAALPAIFSAIRGATELFDVGKEVVDEIRGKPTKAMDVKALEQEVEALPVEQQKMFVEKMKSELVFYQAISQRLDQQGGVVNAETLSVLAPAVRSHIAKIRMTTRPWAVRWMVIAVVFPPIATVGLNMGVSVYNIMAQAWWPQMEQMSLLDPGQMLNELYLSMVGWASGVIMTYMGMREIGKARGHDGASLKSFGESARHFMGQVKAVFN